jgi:3-phenylpropionate/trans-cinnamate dioxygenase ferredoxin component
VADFTDVIGEQELPSGSMSRVRADGRDLLLANVDGAFYAADAHCPHLRANLTKGVLDGTVVTCPLHGSQFDLTDGRVVEWTRWSGAVKAVASAVRHPRPLRVYEVKVDAGRVLVGPEKTQPPA